ncbi:MAG: bifunctional DNA primase/polymerase [Candidatus Caldarchaeum sp.]
MGNMNEEQLVKLYREKGLTILPLPRGAKGPPLFGAWQKLSREEIETKNIDLNDVNIALRMNDNGVFAIDVDREPLYYLLFDSPPEALARKTWVWRTSRGYHVLFKADHDVETTAASLIQVKGRGSYVVAPPSIHPSGARYTFLSDPATTDIANVGPAFLEKLSTIISTVHKHQHLIEKLTPFWLEGCRHNIALYLSGALRKRGLAFEETAIIVKAISLLSQDPEITDRLTAVETTYSIDDLNEVAGDSYLAQVLKAVGGPSVEDLLPAGKHDASKQQTSAKKHRYTVGGEVLDGRLVEVIAGPRLLLWNGSDFEVAGSFQPIDGEVVEPYPHLPFPLPDAPTAIGEDINLWNDTKAFIREYFDVVNEDAYDVLTAAVAWSYFVRAVGVSTPFILFLGPWRSGKTRALETLSSICYRSMAAVDVSEASFFRLVETLKPTLFIDEMQVVDSNVRALLASAYRKGMKVPRVVDVESKGLESIAWFETFSFVVMASREEPPADILSRCIVIHCEKQQRPTGKKIDESKARDLRTRWLAQRLRMHGKVVVGFTEFETVDGRLQEILSPLVVLAELFGGPSAKAAVERYGRALENELRGLEASTEEAEIIEALQAMVAENPQDAPSVVLVRELTARLNQEYETPIWTPEKVGRRLSALGFPRVKLARGRRGYKIDYPLLERLINRYGLDVAVSSFAATATTATTAQTPKFPGIKP